MDRRKFLASAAGASIAAQGVAAAAKPGAAKPSSAPSGEKAASVAGRPNILWICTDQQRWDTIGALGNPHIRTPHLDELCRTGTAFTHAHCQNPICTPSRASFLTGRYPRSVDACLNGNERWQDRAPLVTKLLADAGYDCGLAGKLHLSAAHERIESRPDDGYRVFHWSHHPKDSWPKGHAYNDWLKSQGIDYNETMKRQGYIPAEFHQTTWCADRAIDFMNEKRSGPWLFSLNCFDPHPPLDPPKDYLDRFDQPSLPLPSFQESDLEEEGRLEAAGVNFQSKVQTPDPKKARSDLAKYWAMIELIDHNVGRLLKALEESGQRENTLVIYTSDHGHMIWDHGLTAKGCRFYEGLVRVPLIFSMPGVVEQGVRNDGLIELLDLAPTLLELAGQPEQEGMHGHSLLPALKGGEAPERRYVRSTYSSTLQGPASYATMIRDRRYKLVNYHGTGQGQLFDLEKDPDEHANLWNEPSVAAVKAEMMSASFDAEAMTADLGGPRVGRY